MKREFVLLAQDLPNDKRRRVDPHNYFASIKLDGMRAIWIPSTVGVPVAEIPWANRVRDMRDHISTGLWSRYVKPIFAPDWFLKDLPRDYCLDGELWCGRQRWDQTMSTVKKLVPVDSEWAAVKYMILDSPTYRELLRPGVMRLDIKNSVTFPEGLEIPSDVAAVSSLGYEFMYHTLKREDFGPCAQMHQQVHLSRWEEVDQMFDEEVAQGGEGIILRRLNSVWIPKRDTQLWKLKPYLDAEGVVVGWTPGEGKHQGRMGSLTLRMPDGKTFGLSGFTDEERELWAPDKSQLKHFKIGETITYRYRELSSDGIPKEARYYRKRVE